MCVMLLRKLVICELPMIAIFTLIRYSINKNIQSPFIAYASKQNSNDRLEQSITYSHFS